MTTLPPHHPSRGARRRGTTSGRRGGTTPPRRPLAIVVALLAALALAATACGSGSDKAADQPHQLRVFAASSLTDAFTQLGADFTAAHPYVKLAFNFAGSNDLVTQLQQGAPADVLATADDASMAKVGELTDQPYAFAGNKLMIAVEPGDPQHITGLADLARKGLKVVLAAPEVPAGNYAQEALGKAGVTVKPVSLEVSVKGVVTKISLGEADAGIVYVTDVAAAKGKIDGVAIPDGQNVIASYPIATLNGSKYPDDAKAFMDLVLSDAGQKVLADHGFLPAP